MKNSKFLFLSLLVCSMCFWLWPLDKVHAQNTDLSVLVERAEAMGMEQTTLSELQSRAQSRGISNEELGKILESALSLSEQNLPGQLAIDKALEGLSKGVPGERLVPVVDRVGQGMRQAAEVVDPWIERNEVQGLLKQPGQSMSENGFRNEMIKATSKSFVQNVPSDNVQSIFNEIGSEEIISRSTPGDLITAVSILPDLPTTANQPKVSASFIVRALKGGFDADKLQQLPSAMKMGQQRSQLPAASIIGGVAQRVSNGTRTKRVLQSLFDGNVGSGPPGHIPGGLTGRPSHRSRKHENGGPERDDSNNCG
jgi:hypothetical protein